VFTEQRQMACDVTLIPGVGIGPELIAATCRVLETTGVEFNWDVQEAGTPQRALLDSTRRNNVVLKGPTTEPIVVNTNAEAALFEPNLVTAPEYAGLNKVNPTPMIVAGMLILRYLNEDDAADRLERAIQEVIAEGKSVTFDLKPDPNDPTAVGTSQMADGIIARLAAAPVGSAR
jgi:isocitrate/isopropylmalate dehydrogenase